MLHSYSIRDEHYVQYPPYQASHTHHRDIIVPYFTLSLTLLIRYGENSEALLRVYNAHLEAFSFIFAGGSLFFMWPDCTTSDTKMTSGLRRRRRVAHCRGRRGAVFLFVPSLITPKTNLFVLLGMLAVIGSKGARYNRMLGLGGSKERLLFVGRGPVTDELIAHIEQNPQLGYKIPYHMKGGLNDPEFQHLAQIFIDRKISAIVIPSHIKKNLHAARVIYHQRALGISVIDVATLYERVFEKVPLA